VPVSKKRGDALVAGSVLVDGPIELVVERIGADTALAGIVALVTRAQAERPRLARAGETAAAHFVARVLALAALTAIGWSFVDPSRAFAAALAVLVVSCPARSRSPCRPRSRARSPCSRNVACSSCTRMRSRRSRAQATSSSTRPAR
jgi:hypothetical protein